MRIFLIILLLTTHTFEPYYPQTTWSEVVGIDCACMWYQYVTPVSHFISMPAFIFLSGYIFGYQHRVNKVSVNFFTFLYKKIKRLIFPSILFSVLYFGLFSDINTIDLLKAAYNCLNGCGHLWFLPMLFWCFVAIYFCDRFELDSRWILIAVVLLAVLPIPTLPLRLTSFCEYYIFFYLGYVINKYNLQQNCGGVKLFVILTIIYIALIYIYIYIYQHINVVRPDIFYKKFVFLISHRILKLLLGLLGISIAYYASRLIIQRRIHVSNKIIQLSGYCYGVYILHQFIIKYIYYYTLLPQVLNQCIFPWLATSVVATASILITHFLLKCKIGRFLIG
jgi:hypothetical protein